MFVGNDDCAIAVAAGADTFGISIGMEYDRLDTEISFDAEISFNLLDTEISIDTEILLVPRYQQYGGDIVDSIAIGDYFSLLLLLLLSLSSGCG